MSDKTDRRAARTKKALMLAMLELLSKKEISKITVSELAEKADIGRGTFYLHYSDPYDLLDKLEDDTLASLVEVSPLIEDDWSTERLLTHLEGVWRYIYENMSTFKVLTNRWNGVRFMEKFKRYSEKIALSVMRTNKIDEPADRYGVLYVISGTLGVFEQWMAEGAPLPPERLAHIMRNIIKPS
jgi:AcrR family transcriptional regulator